MGEDKENKHCAVKTRGDEIDIYIYSEISDSYYYIEALEKLRNHPEDRYANVRIDSNGGWLRTGMMFFNAIRDRKLVRTYIDQEASSAAAVIALASKEVIVAPSSYMLLHTASASCDCKTSEIEAWTLGSIQFAKAMLAKSYRGFLTVKEMERLFKGEDFWFDSDEIKYRLEKRAKQ